MEEASESHENRNGGCCKYLKSPAFGIFASHTLSSWGDRMWHFAIGLYLVFLSEKSLRLAAIYGFSVGVAVLLLGGIVGYLVDKNQRLKVVQVGLAVQNLFVIFSAVALGLRIHFADKISPMWDGGLTMLIEAAVIGLAIVGELASLAVKISVEKDWVVVIAGNDSGRLASLNAKIRRLDLLCNILAPILVGQVMSFTSMEIGTVFIAGWNIFSCILEFWLLLRVYRAVPSLAKKKLKRNSESDKPEDTKEAEPMKKDENINPSESQPPTDVQEHEEVQVNVKPEKSCVQMVFQHFIILFTGWKTYWNQSVFFAGMALALLYMTVLGFNSITSGYIYSQGIPEWAIGVCMGLGSITGLVGTYIFIFLRKRIGIVRTGLISFCLEIMFLSFCVISIWAPGSPFDLNYASKIKTANIQNATNCSLQFEKPVVLNPTIQSNVDVLNKVNGTTYSTLQRSRRDVADFDYLDKLLSPNLEENKLMIHLITHEWSLSHEVNILPIEKANFKGRHEIVKREAPLVSSTGDNHTAVDQDNKDSGSRKRSCPDGQSDGQKFGISVILFIIGIVTSRTGLWMADLTVTQLLQESIHESERGIVNGVQTSLNRFMDMLQYLLVILVPRPETFGIPIILSFAFICAGGLSFAIYARKARGHLFHFDKICSKTNVVIEAGEELNTVKVSQPEPDPPNV